LAEGLDIRATARVFDVDPNTIETWLKQAAEHMEAVSAYLIHDLQLTQVQVDELWALLGRRDSDEEGGEKQRGKRWVWAGMDPESKLMLGYVIGDRSQACAQLLIDIIVALLAPGCIPVFFSDGWSAYGTALLTHFGHWVETPRRYKRGAEPKPRWLPLPELQYAQVLPAPFGVTDSFAGANTNQRLRLAESMARSHVGNGCGHYQPYLPVRGIAFV
jgi:IS1 family transposase